MKRCELCKRKARMYCASDQANLCCDCDAIVHSANFLVAKHFRNLLCGVCQSQTPWTASGGKLRPKVFVCEQCISQGRCNDNSQKEVEVGEVEANEVEMLEDNEMAPPPPPIESTFSDDEAVSSRDTVISRNRFQIEANQRSRPTKTFSESKKESKMMASGGVEAYRSTILVSLRRLHQEDMASQQEIVELCASP